MSDYARRVGERLRDIRRQKGLSLQDVESRTGQEFKASVLGAYERGERAISVPRLHNLAEFYEVPADQLLPGAERSQRATAADAGRVTLDLARLHQIDDSELEPLARYVSMIQVQRQDFNGKVMTIRRDDLRALACLYEMDGDQFEQRLATLGVAAPVGA